MEKQIQSVATTNTVSCHLIQHDQALDHVGRITVAKEDAPVVSCVASAVGRRKPKLRMRVTDKP